MGSMGWLDGCLSPRPSSSPTLDLVWLEMDRLWLWLSLDKGEGQTAVGDTEQSKLEVCYFLFMGHYSFY